MLELFSGLCKDLAEYGIVRGTDGVPAVDQGGVSSVRRWGGGGRAYLVGDWHLDDCAK